MDLVVLNHFKFKEQRPLFENKRHINDVKHGGKTQAKGKINLRIINNRAIQTENKHKL